MKQALSAALGFTLLLAGSNALACGAGEMRKIVREASGVSRVICEPVFIGKGRYKFQRRQTLIKQASETTSSETVKAKATRTESTSVKKVTSPKSGKTIIRRTVRRKKTTTPGAVVAAPAPKKEKETDWGLQPLIGCSHYTLSGNLIKNSFANAGQHGAGYIAGFTGEWRKDKGFFGLETGLLYIQTGTVGTEGSLNGTQGLLNHVYNDGVYIPLTAKLYLIRKESFQFLFKAGVLGGSLLSSEIGVTTTANARRTVDGKDFFKSTDFQGNAGIGARFGLAKDMSLGVEMSYARSFNSISNASTLAGLAGGTASGNDNDAVNEGVFAYLTLSIDI